MSRPRSHLLLFLLATTPIALLAWLGTYLIRDAARRTDATTQAVLTERLTVVDHQLVNDLRQLTDQYDEEGSELQQDPPAFARLLGNYEWVAESWLVDAQGGVSIIADKHTVVPSSDGRAAPRSASIRAAIAALTSGRSKVPIADASMWAFRPAPGNVELAEDRSRQAVWQTFVKTANYHLAAVPRDQISPSGWHVTDGDFIYWRAMPEGTICCARMEGKKLLAGLFSRIPTPGLELFPGRMMLKTYSGIPLTIWGKRLPGSDGEGVAKRRCGDPLSQWVLSYSPAAEEFPKPYLFPILLGIGSGSLLVLALAWIYFRESARELRVAQQRVTFVNQVSHELKTPLTNIRLYAEMAYHRAESLGDTIAQRQLGVVETETTRLNRLIQNVLNYARQQRDKLTVQPSNLVLDEVTKRAVDNWRPLLENKGFVVETHYNGPAQLYADADAIEQIIGNLLSNVDKYASYGKWVAIRTESDEKAARLIVEDRGPGIPSGKRRAVFEAFERLRSDLTEGVSGTGIGLTISRELAELHGGTLRVCSSYRDGAKFILTLPLKSV